MWVVDDPLETVKFESYADACSVESIPAIGTPVIVRSGTVQQGVVDACPGGTPGIYRVRRRCIIQGTS